MPTYMTPSKSKNVRRLWLLAYVGIACALLSVVFVFASQWLGNDYLIPTARLKIREIAQACNQYQLDHDGQVPKTLDLLLNQDDQGKGPYLRKENTFDPWGNTFFYDPTGNVAKRKAVVVAIPDIYCRTPDGRTIGNWKEGGPSASAPSVNGKGGRG